MLHVEERLHAVERVRVEELLQPRDVERVGVAHAVLVEVHEVREHEVEPLHALAHDRREVLIERGLPLLGAVVEDDVAALQQPVGVDAVLFVVREDAGEERRLGVVVAVDEQLLDVLAVGTLVAGEHGAPDVAERAQLGDGAVLREVAAGHHAVGLARVHVLERVAQHVRAVRIRRQEVDVADHPEPRQRLLRHRNRRHNCH